MNRWIVLALAVPCFSHSASCGGTAPPGSNMEKPKDRSLPSTFAAFDLDSPERGPFPSDRFTVADSSQLTYRRVNLPLPDAASRPSDHADVGVINTLDGFNLQPRLSIPFSGPIDVTTVDSSTVFLIGLGDTTSLDDGGGRIVGIDQTVWDVATNTLHVESDELLDQHARYALVVTRGVRDAAGLPVEPSEAFARFRHDLNFGQTADPELRDYRESLLDALDAVELAGVRPKDVVTASVFTTLSVTAVLEKMRDQIHAATPAPADFDLGPSGERTVFPLASVTSIASRVQPSTAPTLAAPVEFQGLLNAAPGAIGTIAFGRYTAPEYRNADRVIPPTGTRSGVPVPFGSNTIILDLYLPSGPRPAGGWPVAIVGHGNVLHKNNGPPVLIASKLASKGVATIAVNGPGNGGGPLGTLTVTLAGGVSVTFPSGGRQVDVDGNGSFAPGEGGTAAGLILGRDRVRQIVAELMTLVRVIETGIDTDEDGARDLDSSRIYFVGQSFGGICGTVFLAIEPNVRVGVLNVTINQVPPVLSPLARPLIGGLLASRVPSLINPPGLTSFGGVAVGAPRYDENLPLPDLPPLVNTVAGAMEIQEVFENMEWVLQAGGAGAHAAHLHRRPLAGVPEKAVLFQFGKGDQSAPNPSSVVVIRAGDLAGTTTFYRHDIAYARNPALPKDPHNFLLATLGANPPGGLPAAAPGSIALAAQQQIADFLESDGVLINDPDGADTLFEAPIEGALPAGETSYIP